MSSPACPQCGNHTFIASAGSVLNPSGKYTLIYCDRCGYPVAAAEQFEDSPLFQEILRVIRHVSRVMGIRTSL